MKKLINYILLFMALTAGGGLCAIMLSRRSFEEISRFSYPADGPLMGSYWVDVVVRPEAAIVVMLLMALVLVKEFLFNRIARRIAANLSAITIFMVLGVASIHGLYIQPAAQHGVISTPEDAPPDG